MSVLLYNTITHTCNHCTFNLIVYINYNEYNCSVVHSVKRDVDVIKFYAHNMYILSQIIVYAQYVLHVLMHATHTILMYSHVSMCITYKLYMYVCMHAILLHFLIADLVTTF